MSIPSRSDNNVPSVNRNLTENNRPATIHASTDYEPSQPTHKPLTEPKTSGSIADTGSQPDLEHEQKRLPSSSSDDDTESSCTTSRDPEKDAPSSESTTTTTSSPLVASHEAYDPTKLLDLPPQHGPALYRAFRWQFFTVYRKIYTVVFLLNLVWGVVGFRFGDFGDDVYAAGKLTSDTVATAVAVNVMVGIAVRNEHVINVLFATCISAPRWTPLWFRRSCAMVYSYGGFHSGCTTAAAAWYAVYAGVAAREYASGRQPSPVFVVLAALLLALLVAIVVLALPSLRQKYHNRFEGTHRFAGWTVLALFWAQLIASAILQSRTAAAAAATTPPHSAGYVLATSPAFWFLAAATLLVIYPWARLRKRAVTVDALSTHAIRIHFPHARQPALCSAIRIADRPLVENHAFATIPTPPSTNATTTTTTTPTTARRGFSVVVSAAGDWTRRVIAAPPRALWVRSGPNQGMAAVTRLFSPVVLVATGSGIGPCLGFFVGAPGHDVRVIWSTKNPLRTYGPDVLRMVRAADPRARVVDTDQVGRPDIVRLAYTAYRESGAEAVCIVSNKKVVDMVVFEMESRGVPAYGPIWDS